MSPSAGWYDDPRDPQQLRYWDGEAWTEHVTQQVTPQVTGQQQAPDPVPTWHFPGGPEAQQQDWRFGGGAAPAPPAAPQQPTYPGGYPPAWTPAWPTGPTTPDGASVTTWAKRFAAWLLDGLIVFFASLPLTGYFLYRYVQTVADDMDSGTMNGFLPSNEAIHWELAFLAVLLVIEVLYQTICLRRWGATPGKRALGISVRRWDAGGVLPWQTIARRVGFIYGLAVLGQVPVIGILASLAWLLDGLWPLWDKRNQALHDKFADTAVVEGPRRDSTVPRDRR